MFDALVDFFASYPYVGVGVVFVLCGIGFPLPEELVLVAAGYVCFKNLAALPPMLLTCAGAILLGDLAPYLLGRTFGTRLLRVRALRMLVTKRHLAVFDRWFRRRGDLVIFFARFVTGLRMVAYFTAGTMKMPMQRFVLLDLIGIVVVVPVLVLIGYSGGPYIDDAIDKVQRVERGILIASAVAAVAVVGWLLLRRRRQLQATGPRETFVGPTIEPKRAAPQGDETERKQADPPPPE